MWLKTLFKWLGILLGAVLGIALLAAIVINLIIAFELDRTFDIPGKTIEVPTSEEAITEGARLAKLRGCNGGCHGDGSTGRVFFEMPGGSRVVAPNIVWAAQNYPIKDFERVVRHGIRPDGSSLLIAMPSAMLSHLSDEDLGAITAFLRSRDPGDNELETSHHNAIGRLMLFYFRQRQGSILAADVIDHDAKRLDPDSEIQVERGQYLALTVCSECHGDDLRGSPEYGVTDLVVVKAYNPEQFSSLMREGKALGDRELGLMADVAESRFAFFTDNEIVDLHAFLQTLADAAPAP